jgi:UDP-N-acetylmuramoyl-L-alanyl-D-glutamate--2,6-diaminopimelate ligase
MNDPSGLQQTAALVETVGHDATIDAVHDSTAVGPGSVFVCLRGRSFDGHDFAPAAIAAGAVAVVSDHEIEGIDRAAQIVVDDTRLRAGPIAAVLNGHPSRALTAVGITGTNGKTTTAHLVETILRAAGRRTGMIGTLSGARTTPEAPDLQRTLRGFVDDGVEAAVLEVSSHALALYRADGVEFDVVAFTNLGHDHLDLHGSQEAYFRAKARLFEPAFAPIGVINVGCPYGRLLADTAGGPEFRVVAVSLDQVTDVEVEASAHRYRWRSVSVEVPIGGRFNVTNSLVALTIATELGIEPEAAAHGLRELPPVPGRFEVIRTSAAADTGITVVVDYAHTSDGLAEVLGSARAVADPGAAVTVVFGCGGDRDHHKRPEMGRVAADLADRVVVTSDNPRGESPEKIIDDIVAGIDVSARSRVAVDPDRRSAIAAAVAGARRGDVVVIAGKGHETNQEFAGRTVEFDDRAVAREVLNDVTGERP